MLRITGVVLGSTKRLKRLLGCSLKKVLLCLMLVGAGFLLSLVNQAIRPSHHTRPASRLSRVEQIPLLKGKPIKRSEGEHYLPTPKVSTPLPTKKPIINYEKEEEDYLLNVLESRLQRFSEERHNFTKLPNCQNLTSKTLTHTCKDNLCEGKFSASPRQRLRQILKTRTAFPQEYQQALAAATKRVKPHKYIFVSGASSNHLPQLQHMVKTFFDHVVPAMKGKNFTFVIYNFGLTTSDKRLVEYNCKCTVLDFPFDKFPEFVSYMVCYSWKPLSILPLMNKAEYLVWMDASIRWKPHIKLDDLFARAKERSFQLKSESFGAVSARTVQRMADYFGDSLCQYSPFREFSAGFLVIYNDRFVREAILQPWVSCALNRSCMCVENYKDLQGCRRRHGGKQARFSMCHRFDQSAMGFIWSKLLLQHRAIVEIPRGRRNLDVFGVLRHVGMNWFRSENDTKGKKLNLTQFPVRTR
ncbi:hypothetical protein ACOMHN_057184 [Nucella lapillus]